MIRALSIGIALLWVPAPALACTAFLLTEGKTVLMGKSYDWSVGSGQLVVNKRAVAKRSIVFKPGERALEWVSRHASLSFNQHGRELPVSGMNEAGLAIETLWLEGSRYPDPDARPTLNELQLVQWVLDSFSSVGELASGLARVRVAPVYGRVHYLACDASGACASIEHLGGKLVLHRGAELPVPVLTNHAYGVALGHLHRHRGFGGSESLPAAGATGSLDRFTRAAAAVRGGPAGGHARAFRILESVKLGAYTKWNLVYDLGRRRAYYRTSGASRVKWLDLGTQNLSCKAPVRVLDLEAAVEGDVQKALRDYTIEANRRSIVLGFKGIGGALPKGALDQLAIYPDRLPCTAARPAR
jgi:choloylglycine hydrolase